MSELDISDSNHGPHRCMYVQEKFDIERKHTRSILRVLKRSPLRCSVWQKRTLRKHLFIGEKSSCRGSGRSQFLSKLLSLGQAVLPLDKLENRVEVRATLDLLDEKGRKPVGGKMEVAARLREPFTGTAPHCHHSNPFPSTAGNGLPLYR